MVARSKLEAAKQLSDAEVRAYHGSPERSKSLRHNGFDDSGITRRFPRPHPLHGAGRRRSHQRRPRQPQGAGEGAKLKKQIIIIIIIKET